MNFKKVLHGILSVFFLLGYFQLYAVEKGPSLYFPVTENHVQPLPQKFEYSLRDAYRLLLGNRIIDTTQFEFVLRPTDSSWDVDIKWPENLFDSGTLNLLSPSGVSVWSAQLKDKQNSVKISNSSTLVNKLLTLSFFKYCISQYKLSVGVEICSPELVIRGAGAKLRVDNNLNRNKAQIQINGKSVTPHGIVFLNDEKESLSFRALAASGAEFKMDTRSISLKFLDVVSIGENLMAITIKGPFPLAPSQYKIIKDDIWSVVLKKDRALVYIAGEGQVPLRQEFVVQGPVPSEKNRIYLERSSPTSAYASGLELRGWSPVEGLPQAADASSEVTVTGSRFSWFLKNLNVGQDKMSTIQIADDRGTFTAGYSFSRSLASRLELLFGLNSYKNTFYLGGEAQMWFESLPILSELSQQRVGLGIIYNQDLNGDAKVMLSELDAYWRVKRGLQLLDATLFFGIGIQNWTFDSQSLQTLAPFVGWMGPAFKKLNYFDWQEFHLKQSLKGKTSQFEMKSRTDFRWKLYHTMLNQNKIRYSVGAYVEDATDKRSGALLEAAWVMVF